MKIAQLERWRTSKLFGKSTIVNLPDGTTEVQIENYFLYEAGLGDFLRAYYDHLAVPWWRRSKQWRQTEAAMRQVLNDNKVRWG